MGRITPRTALSSVLLPAPFGPRTVTISPRWTVRSTSVIVGVSPYPAARPATVSVARTSSLANEVGIDDLLVVAELGHRPGREHLALGHHDHRVAHPLDRAE